MKFFEKKTNVLRGIVGLVVGSSAYAVTSAIIKNNVEEPDSKAKKAELAIGRYAIGQTVGLAAAKYVDDRLNDFIVASEEAKRQHVERQDTQS